MNAQLFLTSHYNAVIDNIPRNVYLTALLKVVDNVRNQQHLQYYSYNIIPILAFVYTNVDNVYGSVLEESVYQQALNMTDLFISNNDVPINSRALDKDKLTVILDYVENFIKKEL